MFQDKALFEANYFLVMNWIKDQVLHKSLNEGTEICILNELHDILLTDFYSPYDMAPRAAEIAKLCWGLITKAK